MFPEHRNNFAHGCFHDSRYRDKYEEHHKNFFFLKERPLCKYGKYCPNKRDPERYMRYEHMDRTFMRIYMFCSERRDTSDLHRKTYSYIPFTYHTITKDMVEEIIN